MSDEYKMLRNEMEDKIKQQDSLYNAVFTILGISSVFSTFYENIAFLYLISFISFVLLVRIEGNRVYVYAILTYLRELEKEEDSNQGISWEKRLNLFRQSMFKIPAKQCNPVIRSFAWLGPKLKHVSNLALVSFICYRTITLIVKNEILIGWKISLCIVSVVLFLLNVLATVAICSDKKLNSIYSSLWEKLLLDEKNKATVK